ncbi:MAG: LysR family transcriptional regulator [Comamonadaceae bacterium]|nr:LysR family transcriptional regulator [Comamonadaceae bacterium]
MEINNRQLIWFMAIADTGSFRQAAERLHTTQPALSVAMQKLEATVGALLLDRTPKGVSLTSAGRILYEHASRGLSIIEIGRRQAADQGAGKRGPLRLGFVGSAAYSSLPRLLAHLTINWPDLRLELSEGASATLLDKLRHEALDACIVREPIKDASGLTTHCIEIDRMVLAVPVSHPLAQHARVKLSMLRDEAFIAFAQESVPSLSIPVLELCSRAGFVPRIVQEATRLPTVVSLVACGLGVALVPSVARMYSHAHIRFIDLDDDARQTELRLSLAIRPDAPTFGVLCLLKTIEAVGTLPSTPVICDS